MVLERKIDKLEGEWPEGGERVEPRGEQAWEGTFLLLLLVWITLML